MTQLPKDLDESIAQARESTQAALKDGKTRIMVELVFPELKQMPIAWDFLPALTSIYGAGLKVFFPDTGAAALARRDWKLAEFTITDLGNGKTPLEPKVQPEDEAFLLIEPSSVEVLIVEELCQLAGDRPCILFNPKLEDVSIVGIGYAARQLRDRFISTLEPYYYLRPMDDFALLRAYPDQWQVWQLITETTSNPTSDPISDTAKVGNIASVQDSLEQSLQTGLEDGNSGNSTWQMIAELPEKPVGDVLDRIMMGGGNNQASDDPEAPIKNSGGKSPGLMANLQRFLRALSS